MTRVANRAGWAVLAASFSAALGGTAVVATRLAVPESNAATIAFLRFFGASLVMLALTLPQVRIRVAARDWPPVILLGLLQFGLFSWLFGASLQYIPAARAALVLSTQPLLTLALASALGRERLTLGKMLGSLIAIGGVAFVLGDRATVSNDTVKGDLLMLAAACTGSVFNVAASAYLRKYPAMVLASVMTPVGAMALFAVIAFSGDWSGFSSFSPAGWLAVAYLMTLGGAGSFFFWIWALEHTTPSRVAVTVTVNPIAATALGALILAEPLTWRSLAGLGCIITGITVANWSALADSFRSRV